MIEDEKNPKWAFHVYWDKGFRLIAQAWGYKESEYDIKHISHGTFCIGEVILHTPVFYMRIGGTHIHKSHIQFVEYKWCNGRHDGLGGKSHWIKIKDVLDPEKMIAKLEEAIKKKEPRDYYGLFMV